MVSNEAPAPEAMPVVPDAMPEQVEMPFAIVNGEPVTQLPKDLYIPPQALEVFLEAFEALFNLGKVADHQVEFDIFYVAQGIDGADVGD